MKVFDQLLQWIAMYRLKRLCKSRDSWKEKARDRAEQLREARKSHYRQNQKIKRLEEALEATKKKKSKSPL
jgi:hypothetical protein